MTALGALPNLQQIFDEYAKYVWRSLRHFGVAEADVEDVCQEVFITVHRKLSEFEGRSSLKTWLYGICLRTASDYRRRAHIRRERVVADMTPMAEHSGQQDSSAQAESRQLLLSMLDSLDHEKREVLVLYEIEGFTMKEVAEIVRCPLQTAYSRLYAARARLASEASQEAPG